jgi:hypothetical protein
MFEVKKPFGACDPKRDDKPFVEVVEADKVLS